MNSLDLANDPMTCSSSKRKRDSFETSINVPIETDSLKDENEICGICHDDLLDEDASKACPNSDKHDFHKDCLVEYLDS